MENENIPFLLAARVVGWWGRQRILWHELFQELFILAVLPVFGVSDMTVSIFVGIATVYYPKKEKHVFLLEILHFYLEIF